MAVFANKYPDNVPGKFYVDTLVIDVEFAGDVVWILVREDRHQPATPCRALYQIGSATQHYSQVTWYRSSAPMRPLSRNAVEPWTCSIWQFLSIANSIASSITSLHGCIGLWQFGQSCASRLT